MAVICKSQNEIEKMRASGRILKQIHEAVRAVVAPGVTTMDLEIVADKKLKELGGKAAFRGVKKPGAPDYPNVLCTSVNDEIVHGIPSANRKLKEGDIVSVDCGVILDGYYSDSANTHAVGKVSAKAEKLLQVTAESLQKPIDKARAGNTLGDIGAAVQELVEANGFSVVRALCGHGIGRSLHEEPQIPNYGRAGYGMKLRPGMVLAIEPMVNTGRPEMVELDDHWTAATEDGSLSAHFEHTVAVTENGPLVLTA